MKNPKTYLLFTTLPIILSCSFEKNKNIDGFIGDISYCEEIMAPLKPAVCGKCRLKYEKDRIYIIPAEDCPPYTLYRCTTKVGKNFTINNLHCRPVEVR